MVTVLVCTGVCVLSSFECVGAFAIAMCVKQRATGTEECVQMSARGAREPMQAAEKKTQGSSASRGGAPKAAVLPPPHILPVAPVPKLLADAAPKPPATGAVFAPPPALAVPKAPNPAHYRFAPTVTMVANPCSVACCQSIDEWPKIEYVSATVTMPHNCAEEGGEQALI